MFLTSVTCLANHYYWSVVVITSVVCLADHSCWSVVVLASAICLDDRYYWSVVVITSVKLLNRSPLLECGDHYLCHLLGRSVPLGDSIRVKTASFEVFPQLTSVMC